MQKVMTEKERMLSEKLYIPKDEALAADCARSRRLVRLINGTTEEQAEYRVQLFKELFGRTGENLWVEPPFHCDYGCHISVGENFYANFDCIILDVCDVTLSLIHIFFSPRGSLVCVHRKLKPTGAERVVWGDADRGYFPVEDTPWGVMGSLICWESYMPLARAALYEKGVALLSLIHI